ncbi:MAG: RNA-binding protein [Chitinophagaceae bacterium]|nr:RNA-binding protein [Chitinophagaceae bacterium]
MKLFVAGLPYDMDDLDLREMFELYGTVKSAKVIMDYATRKSKGFGFVEFTTDSAARETIQLLNGKSMEGKTLIVKPAEDQQR